MLGLVLYKCPDMYLAHASHLHFFSLPGILCRIPLIPATPIFKYPYLA